MITRAHAEALLTLAESLEACERLGLSIERSPGTFSIFHNGKYTDVAQLTALELRNAVVSLTPRHDTSWKLSVDKSCFFCFGTGITVFEPGMCSGGQRCWQCRSADALGLPKLGG